MVTSGLAKKIPTGIRMCPYYKDTELPKQHLTKEEYADKYMTEIYAFLSVLCHKMKDYGHLFDIHEKDGYVELILNQDFGNVLENLRKILEIVGEFPARWIWAEIDWKTIEIPEAAESMAKRIVEAFQGQYVHIGNRVGKLEMNDKGEIIFKKRFSKHYGFKLNPMELCKEYAINHTHFKRGVGDKESFIELKEASYWR